MTVTRVDMSQEVPIIDAELDEDSVHENIIENNNEFLGKVLPTEYVDIEYLTLQATAE